MRCYEWHKNILQIDWQNRSVIFLNTNLKNSKKKLIAELVEEEREDLMPGIFRRMCEPSKKIAQMIKSLVDEYGLVPG